MLHDIYTSRLGTRNTDTDWCPFKWFWLKLRILALAMFRTASYLINTDFRGCYGQTLCTPRMKPLAATLPFSLTISLRVWREIVGQLNYFTLLWTTEWAMQRQIVQHLQHAWPKRQPIRWHFLFQPKHVSQSFRSHIYGLEHEREGGSMLEPLLFWSLYIYWLKDPSIFPSNRAERNSIATRIRLHKYQDIRSLHSRRLLQIRL